MNVQAQVRATLDRQEPEERFRVPMIRALEGILAHIARFSVTSVGICAV
jgi:hypothetical protein